MTRAAKSGAPFTVALGPYSGALARAIRRIKFGGRCDVAHTLGCFLAGSIALSLDMVVPMPLHPARMRERGFNQAALIARAVAATLGVALENQAVVRTNATAPQSRLPLAARRANVRDAFGAGRRATRVLGRRVLIVDDVVTTGSTLASCAAALHSSGAAAVIGAALAIRL
ncbi:MAG TPA: phosphoribosyltransferase family protein [Candidatus Eremiobacteraceae bacterium]|nr:phosphoribosyltransferase family protein [Candidatus Eremiobacteraceae bacterium]